MLSMKFKALVMPMIQKMVKNQSNPVNSQEFP